MNRVDGRVADAAMVLAAGHGQRLRPLTNDRAKAMVPFLNRPLLDYALDWLRRCGFAQIVVNLHHCPDSIAGHYGHGAFGVRLCYSVEEELLGTAGGPRAVLEALGERALLVNGDIVASLPLGPLRLHHEQSGALATLALHHGEAASGYPPVPTDQEGRVLGFPASPDPVDATACFTGVHLVERDVLETIPEGAVCGMVEPVYRQLLAAELPVHGVALSGPWHEIGTVARYRDAQLSALRREEFSIAFEGYRRQTAGGWRAPDARVGQAGLAPPYLLANGARIADGAQVSGVVAGRDTRIGPGATVIDSVLLDGARVGTGARLERAIVVEDTYVPPGTRLADGVWTADGRAGSSEQAVG